MIRFFQIYDVTTEAVMLAVCVMMLLIMRISKPRRTPMYKLTRAGIILAVCTMVAHISMLAATVNIEKGYGIKDFYFRYIIYALLYSAELDLIYVYMDRLAYSKEGVRRVTKLNIIFGSIIYLLIFLIPLATGLVIYRDGNVYRLTPFSNLYIVCSILCEIMSAAAVVKNRKVLPRAVITSCLVFFPMELVAMAFQFFFTTTYFMCATYTLPFVIFFILFHSYRFDEVLGCQNYDAETTLINHYLSSGKKFLEIGAKFPKLENHDFADMSKDLIYASNLVFRRIEKLTHRVHIYRIGHYHFSILMPVRSDEEAERVKKEIFRLMDEVNDEEGIKFNLNYKAIVCTNPEGITNAEEYLSVIRTVARTFSPSDTTEIREITKEAYERYKREAVIERALLDIAANGNLDDERVLLYIQPIFNISNEKFKTGEALMRLKIDGKIYYPDSFIPVAENIGCIHALTRIILYKAAKKTVELSKYTEFDAISVNVSTNEFADPNASKEFADIIAAAGANPNNIRLEITESTMIRDYELIIKNMFELHNQGVYFYLDDFGTGFSNLDRVIGMPFKTIKFDKSLLYKALSDEKSNTLFRMLVSFCKTNMLSTVVEGVEDEEQKNFVEEIGFDYIQGYYFSKPVEEKECDSFYSEAG